MYFRNNRHKKRERDIDRGEKVQRDRQEEGGYREINLKLKKGNVHVALRSIKICSERQNEQ